jgi:predicted transglutaminase-like cysteine proteinase
MLIIIPCLAGLAGMAMWVRGSTLWTLAWATLVAFAILASVELLSGTPWREAALSVVLTAAALQIGYLLGLLCSWWWQWRILLVAAVALASSLPHDAFAFSQMKTGEYKLEPLGFTFFCIAKPNRCEAAKPEVVVMTPQRWKELYDVNRSVNHSVKWAGPTGLAEAWRDEGSQGSCVLYANMKRSMLLDRGWPPSALLLTLVRVDGKPMLHVVLVARTDRGDLVLESLGDGMDYNYFGPYEVYHDHHWIKQMSPENPHFWVRIISWLRITPEPFSCK